MLHQHFASLPRQQESVVNQRVEVFDVMKRAIDLAIETARRRFAETSITQPVEIDWSIRIGGKKEGIHGRYNAVVTRFGHVINWWPKSSPIYRQGGSFADRNRCGSGQRSVMLISAACVASVSTATNGVTAFPLTH
jgi:hypothetical protein